MTAPTDRRIFAPPAPGHTPRCGHPHPTQLLNTGRRVTCNRAADHTDRHMFYHRHTTGLVRAVWGS